MSGGLFRAECGASGLFCRRSAPVPGAPSGGGVRRRGGGRAHGKGPGRLFRRAGVHPAGPGVYLSQRGRGLPPVGAPAAERAARSGGGGVPPAGVHRGGPAPAHPSQDPAHPGLPGAARGGALRPDRAGRDPRRRGLRPVRAGGGRGPVCPAGRHPGLLFPRPGQAGAGGVLRGRGGLPGTLRPGYPAAHREHPARRRSCPPPRCCPNLPPAAGPACWKSWTV